MSDRVGFNYLTDTPRTEEERRIHYLTSHIRKNHLPPVPVGDDLPGYRTFTPPAPKAPVSDAARSRAERFLALGDVTVPPTTELLDLWALADLGPPPPTNDRVRSCAAAIARPAGHPERSSTEVEISINLGHVVDEVARRAKAGDPEIVTTTGLDVHIDDASGLVEVRFDSLPAGCELRRRLGAADCVQEAVGPAVFLGRALPRVCFIRGLWEERQVAADWYALSEAINLTRARRADQLARVPPPPPRPAPAPLAAPRGKDDEIRDLRRRAEELTARLAALDS